MWRTGRPPVRLPRTLSVLKLQVLTPAKVFNPGQTGKASHYWRMAGCKSKMRWVSKVGRRHLSCKTLQARGRGLKFILSVIRGHWRVLKKRWQDFYPLSSYDSPSSRYSLLHLSTTFCFVCPLSSVFQPFTHHCGCFLWSLSFLLCLSCRAPNQTQLL